MSDTELIGTIGKKVAVSVRFDTVCVEIICGDDYLAQVLYDDLTERLQKGEGITIGLGQKKVEER
jgi:hypothetical protein